MMQAVGLPYSKSKIKGYFMNHVTTYPSIEAPTIQDGIKRDEGIKGYIEKGKWCCRILPLPILGCFTFGGAGLAFWSGLGVGGVYSALNIYSIAFGGCTALCPIFIGGCYYQNMPNRSFEKNVEVQLDANIQLEKVEGDLGSTISTLHIENEQLKTVLKEANEKGISLENELDLKSTHLLQLTDELKVTLQQLDQIKDDFAKADTAILDAKKLINNMVVLSQKMKENIKSSKVALNLFKENNQDLKKEIKDFDGENIELTELLKNYSEIIIEEHKQFQLLMNICDDLKNNTQNLKSTVKTFSDDENEFSDDIDRDEKNTIHLEDLVKHLEELNK